MKLIRCMTIAVIIAVFSFSTVFAASKPVVKMASELCTYSTDFNNIPLDENTKSRLWNRIYNKLSTMQAEGKLPFELEGENAVRGHKVDEMYMDSGTIYIIPTVMINSANDSSYSAIGETLYNSTVVGGVSLIFVMVEENYDMSYDVQGNGVGFKMLGMVPMVEAETIGLLDYDKNTKTYVNKRTSPISSAEKVQKFVSLAYRAIDNQMNFSSSMKNLKDKNVEYNHNTYQVTDVNISSRNAQQAFYGKYAEDIKFLVAYYYTAAYQQRNKSLVYPPAVGGNNFADDIVDIVTSISLDSTSGKVDISMMKPQHGVRLDISGANYNYANNILSYRVWLAKSPIEGREKSELDRGMARPLVLNSGNTADIDHRDVYRMLLIGLARELGNQRI